MLKFLLQILLGFVCLVFTHAALIVAHDLGWFPDSQLATILMAWLGVLQIETARAILLAVVTLLLWGTADYFLYRRHIKAAEVSDAADKRGDHPVYGSIVTTYVPAVPTGLLTKQWVLNYNHTNPKGRKNISFNPDGTIGEGRNPNEYRWSYANDHLDIIKQDNQLQNRFRYDAHEGKFICTNDLDAKGTHHQIIYQGRVR